jgi:2-keto-4-pentenoate hydratase/2-oxohepta-3-ene-1,7-dioic acid hydratase in catechol pathway
VIPREETRPDFEGELAIVIGRRTYRADADTALGAVGGISAMHDVSGRRAQLETPLRQFTLGKSFDTFAPLGPAVASPDTVDLERIGLRTTVSGEVMQEAWTNDLVFGLTDLIVYLSKGLTLEAGDVIATGTPGGVGDSRTPPRYLEEGDIVEVWVEGVGTLRNSVRRERP